MKDELHRHLDGELPLDALDDETRGQAEAWDRLVSAFRVEARSGAAPPWLEQRVMAEIEALPERSALARLAHWLLQAEPVRVSPLAAGLVMAAFAAVLMIPGRTTQPSPVGPGAPGAVIPASASGNAASLVYVQFVLEAPNAKSVSVAGDFSDWEATYSLQDPEGDGVWTGRVPVRPGVHAYMFLVDGTEWETDPRADRYQDDGFGNRNAVLAVAASE
jgi:Glycogen recognition site of AMP-activated protein kinase